MTAINSQGNQMTEYKAMNSDFIMFSLKIRSSLCPDIQRVNPAASQGLRVYSKLYAKTTTDNRQHIDSVIAPIE